MISAMLTRLLIELLPEGARLTVWNHPDFYRAKTEPYGKPFARRVVEKALKNGLLEAEGAENEVARYKLSAKGVKMGLFLKNPSQNAKNGA